MASVLTARGPDTPTWDALRELAAISDPDAACLSLYLDLNGHAATTASATQRISALLDEAHKKNLLGEKGESILRQAKNFFSSEPEIENLSALALFVSPGFLRALWLPDPVPAGATFGHDFVVAPIVPVLEHTQDVLIVLVGRELGRILRAKRGRVEELGDLDEPIRGQHDQGGRSQARFQRSIDNDYKGHLKRLAERVDAETRSESRPIVVIGHDECKSDFEDRLGAASRALVTGWAHTDLHASWDEISAVSEPLLEAWQAKREADLLARLSEANGRGIGGASGWDETLAASSTGRIQWLLYTPGEEHSAWCCPVCSWAQTASGECPVDGAPLVQDDALDRIIHQTLHYGGKVWALRHEALPETIGALLRF